MKQGMSLTLRSCLPVLSVMLLISLSLAAERAGEQKGFVKPQPQLQLMAKPQVQVLPPDLTVEFKIPQMKVGYPVQSEFGAVIKNIGKADSGPFKVVMTLFLVTRALLTGVRDG